MIAQRLILLLIDDAKKRGIDDAIKYPGAILLKWLKITTKNGGLVCRTLSFYTHYATSPNCPGSRKFSIPFTLTKAAISRTISYTLQKAKVELTGQVVKVDL